MPLNKTDMGRSALLDRSRCRDVLERRVLILSDGRRGREDLLDLLGASAAPAIERLLGEGYLTDIAATPQMALSIVPRTAAPSARAELGRDTAVAPVAAGASDSATSAAAPRRSLAASRMYLLDMLQLQRDPMSAVLKADLHACRDEAETVRRLARALRHLETVVSTSYAQRIGERLAESLPEEHLPALRAARAECPLDAVA